MQARYTYTIAGLDAFTQLAGNHQSSSTSNLDQTKDALLGEVGKGWHYIGEHLELERLSIAASQVGNARTALDDSRELRRKSGVGGSSPRVPFHSPGALRFAFATGVQACRGDPEQLNQGNVRHRCHLLLSLRLEGVDARKRGIELEELFAFLVQQEHAAVVAQLVKELGAI